MRGRQVARAPPGKSTGHTRGRLATKSLKELYDETCRESHVHSNSLLLASLPDRQGAGLAQDVLDISRNYLGDKGLLPLLQVVQRSTTLKRLILSENGLRNNAVKQVCAVAAKHPSLTGIDFSDNYISEGAGQAILDLVEENHRISFIGINNTKIPAELRVSIKNRVHANGVESGAASGQSDVPAAASVAAAASTSAPAVAA
jgi:Ran GTPase-activating protein (RanGAP) involved in mRNA processing and transport